MGYFLARNGLIVLALLAVPYFVGEYGAYELSLYFLYAIAALGLGLAWGQSGVVSLGQGLFFALAAYLTALWLASFGSPLIEYLSLPVSTIVSAVLAASLAAIVFHGRTESGPAFSLITLAMTLCGAQVAGAWTSVTGGFNGLRGFPGLPGLDNIDAQYYVAAAALVIVIAIADWLVQAPLGILWRATSQDERRLAFFGYRTSLLKAGVFGLAGGFAGLAGALYAPQQSLVTPDLSGFSFSGDLLIFAAVGGRRTVLGPVIGAVAVGALSAELRDRISWWELIVATFFIFVVLKLPGGLTAAFGSVKRRLDPIRTPGRPIEAPTKRKPSGPIAIDFVAVRVRIGDVTILDGLALAMGNEQFLCVIGPNGAGKTSTLNVLTGALPILSGRIAIDGSVIRRPTPSKIASLGVGRKFQTPTVFLDLTIGENLSIALWAGRARWFDLFRTQLLDWSSPVLREMLNRFAFLRERNRKASDLSHGERQVLELTMAFASEPRLLLLDEPCAGLSHSETAAIIDAVRWAQRELALRVVVIEHDMELVRRLSDRVVVMHQGRLLADGSIADVQANPVVKKVYAGGAR